MSDIECAKACFSLNFIPSTQREGGEEQIDCTMTLEGQKPYFVVQIARLIILLSGKTLNIFHLGRLPPCPLQVGDCFIVSNKTPTTNDVIEIVVVGV